ncbi:Na+/H+ antiporter-like protein [Chthoniobacter flavus Ellin428]|uniref:Na+/H+ antiporter-like protein n=1 Tax=Chthoniobacter flavus Ellin428 TaxID=497964 RepID=B4DB02_9BACT|nr:Na+/H+ antiporter NhaA [Chthoniobacter flavus]EDY16376.1 Na+/H+ antiporter-like protein [Chthoniobacter flavus Ellin428]TCO92465.1 sodium/proton antiporter (NhaA family) [Chthoniobacter flavus]
MSENSKDQDAPPSERLIRPVKAFTKLEAAGGILLMACTIVALVRANSPWAASYFHLWPVNVTFDFRGAQLSEELHYWINDNDPKHSATKQQRD